jgi:hypothetical protein
MSRRTIVLTIAVTAAVILSVVLLTGGDGDGGEGKVVRGAPEHGFPLRGSLAEDDDAIEGAVARWRDKKGDPDDDVTVLWAGHAGDRDVVMLEGSDMVGEVTRSGQLGWFVAGTRPSDPDDTSGMPVGAGHSVLLPMTGGPWRYVDASRFHADLTRQGDGLLSGNDLSPEGFVVSARDPAESADGGKVLVTGVGARRLSTASLVALGDALADGGARAVWLAARSGQDAVDEGAEDDNGRRDLRRPMPLTLVWTGRLPGRPHAAVVAQGQDFTESLALGFGEIAGERDTNLDRREGQALLGFGAEGIDGSQRGSAVVGGAYLDLDDVPYLFLAGTGVKTLHALVGDRALNRSAPAALIAATPLADAGTRPDTVIFGRDARGRVIAPLTSR